MAAAKESHPAQFISELMTAQHVDFDAISLEQALIDFEVANARVIDLTRRVTCLGKELLASRGQSPNGQDHSAQLQDQERHLLEQERQLHELHSRLVLHEKETSLLRSQIHVNEQTILQLRSQISTRQAALAQHKEEHYILSELCKSRALRITALFAPRLRSAIRQATTAK